MHQPVLSNLALMAFVFSEIYVNRNACHLNGKRSMGADSSMDDAVLQVGQHTNGVEDELGTVPAPTIHHRVTHVVSTIN